MPRTAYRSQTCPSRGIKAVHTLAWLSIESYAAYVLWAGFAGRSDRRAGAAAAVVAGETVAFPGHRCRCPLSQLAGRYGADHAPVTDGYLPTWFAHNMPAIHAPPLVLMACLHARNLMRPTPPLAHRARSRSARRRALQAGNNRAGGHHRELVPPTRREAAHLLTH